MSSVYAPGSRRSRGKLYRPSASVVTLTWTIDLARRAVTTTPSILPSASELTIPVSADCSSAWTASIRGGKIIAAAVAASASISLIRIGLSRRKLVVAVSRLDSPVLGSVDRYGILPHLTPGVERRRGATQTRWARASQGYTCGQCRTLQREGGHIAMFTRVFSVVFGLGLGLVVTLPPAHAADEIEAKAQLCAACHGDKGTPTDPKTIPVIWGQEQSYLMKQLRDFRNGERASAIMSPIAKGLAEGDLRKIAAYFAAKPWPQRASAELPAPPKTIAQCQDWHQPDFP